MEKQLSKKVASYTALFIPAEEGGYTVDVPALEGCVTEGDTLQQAERNAKDAIELYLQTLIQDGLPFPPDLSAIRSKRVKVSLSPLTLFEGGPLTLFEGRRKTVSDTMVGGMQRPRETRVAQGL